MRVGHVAVPDGWASRFVGGDVPGEQQVSRADRGRDHPQGSDLVIERARSQWGRGLALAGLARKWVDDLRIKTPSLAQPVGLLSGGNQQKCVLGKWLATGAQILILDEPTRGIDVGARMEIYELMNRLTDAGVGILMISSDLPEVLGMSDRILVMRQGRIVAEMDGAGASQEQVGISLVRCKVDRPSQLRDRLGVAPRLPQLDGPLPGLVGADAVHYPEEVHQFGQGG